MNRVTLTSEPDLIANTIMSNKFRTGDGTESALFKIVKLRIQDDLSHTYQRAVLPTLERQTATYLRIGVLHMRTEFKLLRPLMRTPGDAPLATQRHRAASTLHEAIMQVQIECADEDANDQDTDSDDMLWPDDPDLSDEADSSSSDDSDSDDKPQAPRISPPGNQGAGGSSSSSANQAAGGSARGFRRSSGSASHYRKGHQDPLSASEHSGSRDNKHDLSTADAANLCHIVFAPAAADVAETWARNIPFWQEYMRSTCVLVCKVDNDSHAFT